MLVIGATNRLDIVDPALLRPGRFDRVVEVPMPDEGARRSILGIHTRGKPLAGNVDLDGLARLAEGMSGAEIEGAVDRAAAAALRRHIGGKDPPSYKDICITHDDLAAAVREKRPGAAGRAGGRAGRVGARSAAAAAAAQPPLRRGRGVGAEIRPLRRGAGLGAAASGAWGGGEGEGACRLGSARHASAWSSRAWGGGREGEGACRAGGRPAANCAAD